MKILLHGLNYAPEEIGIGKYSGEMVDELAARGCDVWVVTTPPYYPAWKIGEGYRGWWYQTIAPRTSHSKTRPTGGRRKNEQDRRAEVRGDRSQRQTDATADRDTATGETGKVTGETELRRPGTIRGVRCPLWVPGKVSGLKRILHLASFGLSSILPVLWLAIRHRPDVIMTVEPAAFCMPTTWLAARLCGAKAWLHVQDFEVDAAFELGILKQAWMKRTVLAVEGFLMRRFDRVSSISPNMVRRLIQKGVAKERVRSFPNWVDCQSMRPLENPTQYREQFGLPVDKRIALYAGNIGAKQGLELIVEAAKRGQTASQSAASPLHYVICGHGAAYESLAEQAQGVDNITLLPVQPFEKFNQLMNCADIHLLPQKADAADLVMPSKLTGMLATGRPVVACASAGTQIAAVVEGRGVVVPPGDVPAFTAAIEGLAGDCERRTQLGMDARRYAEDHLSRTAIIDVFFEDLKEVAGARASGHADAAVVDSVGSAGVEPVSIADPTTVVAGSEPARPGQIRV